MTVLWLLLLLTLYTVSADERFAFMTPTAQLSANHQLLHSGGGFMANSHLGGSSGAPAPLPVSTDMGGAIPVFAESLGDSDVIHIPVQIEYLGGVGQDTSGHAIPLATDFDNINKDVDNLPDEVKLAVPGSPTLGIVPGLGGANTGSAFVPSVGSNVVPSLMIPQGIGATVLSQSDDHNMFHLSNMNIGASPVIATSDDNNILFSSPMGMPRVAGLRSTSDDSDAFVFLGQSPGSAMAFPQFGHSLGTNVVPAGMDNFHFQAPFPKFDGGDGWNRHQAGATFHAPSFNANSLPLTPNAQPPQRFDHKFHDASHDTHHGHHGPNPQFDAQIAGFPAHLNTGNFGNSNPSSLGGISHQNNLPFSAGFPGSSSVPNPFNAHQFHGQTPAAFGHGHDKTRSNDFLNAPTNQMPSIDWPNQGFLGPQRHSKTETARPFMLPWQNHGFNNNNFPFMNRNFPDALNFGGLSNQQAPAHDVTGGNVIEAKIDDGKLKMKSLQGTDDSGFLSFSDDRLKGMPDLNVPDKKIDDFGRLGFGSKGPSIQDIGHDKGLPNTGAILGIVRNDEDDNKIEMQPQTLLNSQSLPLFTNSRDDSKFVLGNLPANGDISVGPSSDLLEKKADFLHHDDHTDKISIGDDVSIAFGRLPLNNMAAMFPLMRQRTTLPRVLPRPIATKITTTTRTFIPRELISTRTLPLMRPLRRKPFRGALTSGSRGLIQRMHQRRNRGFPRRRFGYPTRFQPSRALFSRRFRPTGYRWGRPRFSYMKKHYKGGSY